MLGLLLFVIIIIIAMGAIGWMIVAAVALPLEQFQGLEQGLLVNSRKGEAALFHRLRAFC